ncbi:MAG: tRNA uracil 4-sulfurtransferase ThiI [Succinivibrionaceae bacterium]
MKYIIKFFPEIIIKSKSVRQHMSRVLQRNIRNVLNRQSIAIKIQDCWDKLVIRTDDENMEVVKPSSEIIELLCHIPGIQTIFEVEEYGYTTLHDIYEQTAKVYGEKIKDKTFCVRVKRKGNQEFTSIDVEKYVGGGLNQNFESKGVKLKNPDLTILVEIDFDKIYLVTGSYDGLGGYPLSTQEDVLSLISGGFDSGVSTYSFIKRGCRVHYLFFNMGGNTHEIGVKQESYYIWDKFSSSHKVKFITVPFEEMVGEILTKTDHSVRGVILKRMMMRVASIISKKLGVEAIVTGESVGQVSSQTLTNLSVIDRVSDTLILRPLIVSDKQDIIDKAREIGTIHFAESMPEYCGVISDRPTVKADVNFVEEQESLMDLSLIEKVAENAKWMDIRDIPSDTKELIGGDVEVTDYVASNEIVVDIRSAEEIEKKTLVTDKPHLEIPFFKISSVFADLDKTKTYLLYCDKGVMSKMQAMYIKDQGYQNVKVYRLKEKGKSCCAVL